MSRKKQLLVIKREFHNDEKVKSSWKYNNSYVSVQKTASKYVKQQVTELKGKKSKSSVIFENVKNSQQLIELYKEINKGIYYLNIINNLNIINISRMLYLTAEYTSQVYMSCKYDSVNSKALKSYKVCSLT